MYVLGIDTSNYATSLAVLCTQTKEVVCDEKRFLPVRKGELGLRQSEALFHHTLALPQMLREMKVDLTKIEAVAVSEKPRPIEGSYMPCFLAGINTAQAFCLSKKLPLITTTHQQGHVAAALYATKIEALFHQKILVFHISGGTTDLLLCNGYEVQKQIGGSSDLYAGQAVDRVGVKLGFGFPAGEEVSRLAQTCQELIKPKVSVKGTQCSLSGLENQCNALLAQGKDAGYVAKYCLCFVAQTIVTMIANAHKEYPGLPVVCAGGVMSSECIQKWVTQKMPETLFVPGRFSSDNAIGVARIGAQEVGAWQT